MARPKKVTTKTTTTKKTTKKPAAKVKKGPTKKKLAPTKKKVVAKKAPAKKAVVKKKVTTKKVVTRKPTAKKGSLVDKLIKPPDKIRLKRRMYEYEKIAETAKSNVFNAMGQRVQKREMKWAYYTTENDIGYHYYIKLK